MAGRAFERRDGAVDLPAAVVRDNQGAAGERDSFSSGV